MREREIQRLFVPLFEEKIVIKLKPYNKRRRMQISTRDYFLCRCIFKTERSLWKHFWGSQFCSSYPDSTEASVYESKRHFLTFLAHCSGTKGELV